MYYKIINDRKVFSDCKSLYIESEDRWVSNPSEEMILAEGWQVYIPPEVIPSPQEEPEYQDIIDAVKKMLQSSVEELTDEQALEVAALYPTWHSKLGLVVAVGERLWYDGKLYKVIQGHTVQEDWAPDVTQALYAEVSVEEFPEWVQPLGSADAYMSGDKVSYNGQHYECIVDYNVYAPDVYGWTLIG